MSSREARVVEFGTFVTYAEVEAAMQSEYSKSRAAKGIVFDLSATGWISPQALCTLHCWAFDVSSLGGKVALLPPDGSHQASSFFSSARVLSVLSRDSVFDEITEPSHLGARPRYLSSFQVFPNEEGLEKYLEALSDLRTRHLMLEMHDESQLVDSGYYQDVLIRELVGNSFSHAEGLGSICASYGFERSGKRKSPLLASFTSEKPGKSGSTRHQGTGKTDSFLPYAEICVADSYKSNLWNQISQLCPEDRIPEVSYTLTEGSQDIKDHECDILAAFNYASTTDRSARMKRIQRYIRNWNGKASAIATGLYRVRRVVEQYGGQVIVRADKSLVSLDYSRITSDEPDPKVGCVRRLDGRKLAPLRGTLVCVRIPLEPMLRGREYAARKTRFSRTRGYKDPNIEIIAAPAASAKNGVGALPGLDQFEEDARARFGKADESTFSFVLLDGLADEYQVSRNLLVPLIDLFSLVPRKCGLVVIADDETVAGVHKAAPLLLQTVAEQPLETRAGLVVVGSDDIDPCEIGDPHSSDATCLKGTEVISPSGVRISLKNVASKVRKKRLAEVLMSEAVLRKKEGHLYLIPNRYYTDRYFEIERVNRIPSAFSTLSQWLKEQVTKRQPSAIIVNSSFVLRAVDSAVKNASLATKPDLFRISRDSVLSVAAKCNASCGDTGTVLVVFDVVCTGDLISRFLNVFGRPSNVSIIALVDTRTAPAPFQVSEDSRHVQVSVESIYYKAIKPIRDRGNTPAFKIHRADPKTHLLLDTPKHDEPKRNLQARENLTLLEKAGRVNALATGHFTFHSQHHSYFLSLRPLFRTIETDIIKWLTKSDDSELTDLQNTLGVDITQLQVFCLDADTGLYHIVSRSLDTTQCKHASLLTRSDLQHPLAAHIHTGYPSWFIIPALVNGTSFYECLKLAAGAKAPLTRISVVLDRTNPRTAASLKEVRQFSKTKVQLSRMFTIPISLEAGTCSLCDRERRLQGAALACRHGRYPHLHAVLENASNAMRPIPVENPGLLGTAVTEQSDRLPREFAVRSLLEQAVGGDIQATWDLRKHLVDPNGFSDLAAAATSAPNSLFTRERVADVLHEASLKAEREERLTLSEACTGWTKQASSKHNPDSFARELRGFAQLDPFTLRAHISTLLKRIGRV